MKFSERILGLLQHPLTAGNVGLLQVNVGYRCNMSCRHCHVSAGPDRKQEMDRDTVEAVLRTLEDAAIDNLDITGGAPELNPFFRYLIKSAVHSGVHVTVRSNLTVFSEKGMEDLADFYADNSVEIVASLPCYTADNVDSIRGSGTFVKSMNAIIKLNSLGYAGDGSARKLNLVYNPAGDFLAPSQGALESDYRRVLLDRHGVSFNALYTFANMPVGRFRENIAACGRLGGYMEKLESAFNPSTLDGLMCRRLINVGWDGGLYDCDFNQMLGLSLEDGLPRTIWDFDLSRISGRRIAVADHCYGCTAGQGST